MAFPANANIDVSKFDSAADKISESRPELEKMAGYVNDIIEAGPSSGSGGDLVTDTSPQLGGNLDVNGFSITGPFDPITIESDIININASSLTTIDSDISITNNHSLSIQDGVLGVDTTSTDTNPKQIGLSIEIDNSADSVSPVRMAAISINGSQNGDEIALSINNVETIGRRDDGFVKQKDIEGFFVIRVNGAIKYLPYYGD